MKIVTLEEWQSETPAKKNAKMLLIQSLMS